MPFTPLPPAGSYDVRMAHLEGCLIIVTPNLIRRNIPSIHGPFDSLDADVHVVDGEHAGQTFPGMGITGQGLIRRLEPLIGHTPTAMVLGRLTKQPTKGGKTFWTLLEPTDADVALAERTFPNLAEPAATQAPPPPF